MKQVAVIGAGVLGRTLAMDLCKLSYKVHIWDKNLSGSASSAYQAGGMLAPFSEREQGDELLFQLGLASLELWPALAKSLGEDFQFHSNGTLIVSHTRDLPLWEEIKSKICKELPPDEAKVGSAGEWEKELQNRFPKALHLPHEAHLNPRSFLEQSKQFLDQQEVVWHQADVLMKPEDAKNENWSQFDTVFDCRGLGAQNIESDLRGVRGEAIIVHAPDVSISQPIRIMHPRYSLYVVPRGENCYYLGATQIENQSNNAVTVRSALELLSAAFVCHPGSAEASIIELCHGHRPAYYDNQPEIRVRGKHISINGLFRHGFLLSPIISRIACKYLLDQDQQPFGFNIIKVQDDH